MAIPFFELVRQDQEFGGEVRRRVAAVLDSGQFILGAAVEEFEREFRAVVGCGEAVGMSSGTDAELAILMALGIGCGDAVVTSPFTFFATAGCVSRLGAEPVFVDVTEDTLHLEAGGLRRFLEEECRPGPGGVRLTPQGNRVRAVVPVHLFGAVCAMDEVGAVAEEFGLAVIEDAAQAVGAEYPSRRGGSRAGAIGDAGFFSFFPTKNLGGAGDGGMAVCRDAAFGERLRQVRNHGMSAPYRHERVGGDFRLDAIQAAVLLAKLPHLEAWNARRRHNAALYRKQLQDVVERGDVRLPAEPYATTGVKNHHTYHQYVIRARDRDGLKEHLGRQGIGTAIYYPIPLHLQPCFARYGKRACPVAERAAGEVLALPIFPELREEEVVEVARAVAKFYGA